MAAINNWTDPNKEIISEEDFLEGLDFSKSNVIQRMFYVLFKRIKEMEARISVLETVRGITTK